MAIMTQPEKLNTLIKFMDHAQYQKLIKASVCNQLQQTNVTTLSRVGEEANAEGLLDQPARVRFIMFP